MAVKEIDPVVAAIADSLWQQQRISRATGEAFPAPPPGAGDPLVQAMKLNQGRRDFSPTAPSAPFGYAPPVPQPPGMMLGPEWLGLNFPLAEAISPAGAHMVQGLLGGSGTGDDGLAQFMPGAGDAIDAWSALRYAGEAAHSGLLGDWNDMGQNASWAAIAAMGALPGLDAPSTQGIRAYHGSPHDFDKFDISKIGTGEGAQAYGHGLYFAENEAVAKQYRNELQWKGSDFDDPQVVAQNAIDRHMGDRSAAADSLQSALDSTLRFYGKKIPPAQASANSVTERAIALLRGDAPITGLPSKQGTMYEVNINANPDDFLDWDKPLSEQPEALQRLVREADLTNVPTRLRRKIEAWRGEYTPPVGLVVDEPTGSEVHSALTDFGTSAPENARLTAAMRDAGIPGIKYLDQGSRRSGVGTRNYVVFDDKLIDIVRKYGIAGLLALPALGAFSGDSEASQ